VPQVYPWQARPAATLDQHGTPVVRLQLTGQDDTPAWRAIYDEIAVKDDCPAEIDARSASFAGLSDRHFDRCRYFKRPGPGQL
jgi:hypothetical protein